MMNIFRRGVIYRAYSNHGQSAGQNSWLAAILDYLNHQAEWHVRQMVSQAAGGVGVIAIGVLALRWRHKRRTEKKKRES